MTSLPLIPIFENGTLGHSTNEERNLRVLFPHSASFSKCNLLPIIFSSASQIAFDFVCFPLPQSPSPYLSPSLTSWYHHPLLSGFPCGQMIVLKSKFDHIIFLLIWMLPFESSNKVPMTKPLLIYLYLHPHLSCVLPWALTAPATLNLFLQSQLSFFLSPSYCLTSCSLPGSHVHHTKISLLFPSPLNLYL